MTEPVSYQLDNKVAVIQMDDGKANALSKGMIEGLLAALARAEQEASAVVLAGRAERFCAGFDLRVMMSGPEAATELLRAGSDLLMNLYGATIPLVIACTGHALAGGALVVLTGDFRVGAAGAFKLGLNEVSIGLPVPVLAMELARDRLLPTELPHATLGARIYLPSKPSPPAISMSSSLPIKRWRAPRKRRPGWARCHATRFAARRPGCAAGRSSTSARRWTTICARSSHRAERSDQSASFHACAKS